MLLLWNHGVQVSLLGDKNTNAPRIQSMLSPVSIHCRLGVKSAHQQGGGVPCPPYAGSEVGDLPTARQEGVGWTTNELEELLQKDPNIGPLFAWFRSGNRPSREEVSNADSELKCYWTQWDALELIDGLVYRKFERPYGSNKYSQLLIPRAIRHRFLDMVHSRETGHFAWPETME